MGWELNGVADLRRVAVVATTFCLAAASSLAQSADPSPPSLSELARLVGEQSRALEGSPGSTW
jgi:hypothetical protein